MKKSLIFFTLGLIFVALSIILFLTLKEELINPTCSPTCDITSFTKVFSPSIVCPLICIENTSGQNYTTHDPVFIPLFWAGIISLIIALILFILKK